MLYTLLYIQNTPIAGEATDLGSGMGGCLVIKWFGEYRCPLLLWKRNILCNWAGGIATVPYLHTLYLPYGGVERFAIQAGGGESSLKSQRWF